MFEVVKELQLGDHAALFYQNRAEQLACAVPFIAIGLRRNERCLYIANDNSVSVVLRRLQDLGVNVQKAHENNSLRVATKRETYLRHGLFDPLKMIEDINREVQDSLVRGFSGFRVTGEMSWAFDFPPAVDRIVEYEETLRHDFPPKFAALCQYDECRYPARTIAEMKHIHPVIIRGGNLTRRASQSASDSVQRPAALRTTRSPQGSPS